jgi:hypothetical protein
MIIKFDLKFTVYNYVLYMQKHFTRKNCCLYKRQEECKKFEKEKSFLTEE